MGGVVRVGRVGRVGLVGLWLLLNPALLAQAPELPTEDVEPPPSHDFESRALDEALELVDEEVPAGFGDDPLAYQAFEALSAGRHVRARELTEGILRGDPESAIGHVLLGMILHRGEGNLPLALFHLKKGRQLFEERWGTEPGDDQPWFWHVASITELAFVAGEMGRHEEKLRYLDEREAVYQPEWPADRGWPLMRLRRYGEARRAAERGLQLTDQPDQVATAQTALCAIEAEQLHREASYVECQKAVELDREMESGGPTPYTNAAESALGMLRFDEAEKLILEGSRHFATGVVANPWLDLMLLYVTEGRIPEGLAAMREMFAWRNRQPAYVDEHNRAETDMAATIFLLAAGRPLEASRITGRTVDRPDRTGFTSAESEQMEAAAALLDRAANLQAAELAREEASWSPWWKAIGHRADAVALTLRAWSSGRRSAALLSSSRMLSSSLRPYLAGSMELSEWVEPELVAVVGPGVVAAALDAARASELLPGAEGYFLTFEAEAAWRQGRSQAALEKAREALAELPQSEVMLGARAAAVGAAAALDAGRRSDAFELFAGALQVDPGVVRRLGLGLPCRVEPTEGAMPAKAAALLRGSPRFDSSRDGFRIHVEGSDTGGTACLFGPQDERLACARVSARAGEDGEAVARRLAQELHAAAFAPRLDLTQADLRTLDGSPTAGGGRSAERLRTVLDDLVGDGG